MAGSKTKKNKTKRWQGRRNGDGETPQEEVARFLKFKDLTVDQIIAKAWKKHNGTYDATITIGPFKFHVASLPLPGDPNHITVYAYKKDISPDPSFSPFKGVFLR